MCTTTPWECRAGRSFLQDDSCHLTLVIYIVSSLWNTIMNVVVIYSGAVCHTSLNWLSCVQFQNRHPESRWIKWLNNKCISANMLETYFLVHHLSQHFKVILFFYKQTCSANISFSFIANRYKSIFSCKGNNFYLTICTLYWYISYLYSRECSTFFSFLDFCRRF